MAKLAILSALLLSACVTTDTTENTAKVTNDVTPINVVDEVEIPQATPDFVDYGTVTITGIQIPGRESTATHFDLQTVLEVDAFPFDIEFCAVAETLDSSDVCSSLCDVQGFIARVNDDGNEGQGGCTQQSCKVGDTIVNLDVCSPSNP